MTATMTYPQSPGFKAGGTSAQAAFESKETAETLRGAVLDALANNDLTADECAGAMGKSILSIRPRFSELLAIGAIRDTGQRRTNASGKRAIVWTARQQKQGELI